MTLQKLLESGKATCSGPGCGVQTHEILVDEVDKPGLVFCGWHCLVRYAAKRHPMGAIIAEDIKNRLEGVIERLNKAAESDPEHFVEALNRETHKGQECNESPKRNFGDLCPFDRKTFCQEGDCGECEIEKEVRKQRGIACTIDAEGRPWRDEDQWFGGTD